MNAVPKLKVEVAFDATADMGDWFVIGHPVRGMIDGPHLIADDFWFDVSGDLRADGNTSVSRGRNRQLDDVSPSRAGFRLNSRDGKYDPSNTDSPLHGQLEPMRRIRMSAVWDDGATMPVFGGYIDDWGVSYPTYGESWIDPEGFGPLGTLDAADLDQTSPSHAGDLPGERINRVLDLPEVTFGVERDIDDGIFTLGPTELGGNAFAHLRDVARSDNGWLFESAAGTLTFRDRHTTVNEPAKVTFVHKDTQAEGIRGVVSLGPHLGTDALWNRIVASGVSGNEVTAEDAQSRDEYRTRTLGRRDLLLAHDGDVASLASHLIGRYGRPRLRMRHVTIDLAALSPAEQKQVLGLEIADRVRVIWAPPGGAQQVEPITWDDDPVTWDGLPVMWQTGLPEPVTFELVVEGVEHQRSQLGWHVTFRTSWADVTHYFEIGTDAIDGAAVLAF